MEREHSPENQPSEYGRLRGTYRARLIDVKMMYLIGLGVAVAGTVMAWVTGTWEIAAAGVFFGIVVPLNGFQNSRILLRLYESGVKYDSATARWECAFSEVTALRFQGNATKSGLIIEANLVFETARGTFKTGKLEYPLAHDAVVAQMRAAGGPAMPRAGNNPPAQS